MPIFRVKSVKIYTGQKNLHEYFCGSRDKYEVCQRVVLLSSSIRTKDPSNHPDTEKGTLSILGMPYWDIPSEKIGRNFRPP